MKIKNQKLNYSKWIYILLATGLVGYLILFFMGDFRSQMINYFLVLSPIYISYFFLVYFSLKEKNYKKYNLFVIILVSAVIRLLFIATDPILSDDVYRYLWDGKVFANGINPYAFAPSAQDLANLKDTTIFPLINFPDIPTVYPPVAQFIFFLSNLIFDF